MEALIFYKWEIFKIILISLIFNSTVNCNSKSKIDEMYFGRVKFIPGTEYYIIEKKNDIYILDIYIVVKSSIFHKKDTLFSQGSYLKGSFCTVNIMENGKLKLTYDSDWKYSNDDIHQNITLSKPKSRDLKMLKLLQEREVSELKVIINNSNKFYFDY